MRVRGGQSSESRLSPLLGSALLSPAAGQEGASLALGCRWTCTKAAAVSPHVGLSELRKDLEGTRSGSESVLSAV